jgi:hypothetical protein
MKESMFTEAVVDHICFLQELNNVVTCSFLPHDFWQRPRPWRLWGPLISLDHLHPFSEPRKPYTGSLFLNLHCTSIIMSYLESQFVLALISFIKLVAVWSLK